MPRTEEFFNNPDIPQQMLLSQNEQLTAALQDAQLMIDELKQIVTQKNNLAEAEMVKQQGAANIADGKNQVELAKLAQKDKSDTQKLFQDDQHHEENLTFDYTKLGVTGRGWYRKI